MKTYRHNTPYSAKEKLKAITMLKNNSIEYVSHRYHCSERSLYRWRKKYDTPRKIGEKMQLNVKHVPYDCRTKQVFLCLLMRATSTHYTRIST